MPRCSLTNANAFGFAKMHPDVEIPGLLASGSTAPTAAAFSARSSQAPAAFEKCIAPHHALA